ncbi:phage tail spike protein, partial [Actinomyces minihominis]|uniref:phage tail spike protein n=1 Tax=Actinomyces minihominis TaxID=2002838 RepID=UPI000C085CE2
MITVHARDARDFTYSGQATLDADIINPVVVETLNGSFTLEFDYPAGAPNADLLVVESIVAAPVPGMSARQGFRISEIGATTDSMLHVVCLHVFYDLATNLVADTFIVNKTPAQALTQLLGAAQFPTGYTSQGASSPIANIRVVRMSVAAAILDAGTDNTLISRLGGDYTRNNFHILQQSHRGADHGVVIADRKNLTGYKSTLDFSTVTTRILPVGFDGLLLPELYVDSPRVGEYLQPHVRVVRFEKVKAAPEGQPPKEDELTLTQAYAELRRLAKLQYSQGRIDQPAASYSVSFADLASTVEYADLQDLEQVLLGDTVTVIHTDLGQRLTSRVVAYEYNPLTGSYLKVTLGSTSAKFTSLTGKVNALSDAAQAAGELADFALTSASGKNTNYYGTKQPANPQLGDVWFKENGELTEIWIWTTTSDGTPGWVSLASDLNYSQIQAELDIAKAEIQTAIDAAKDAESAAKEASEAIDAAQTDISEAKQAATDAEETANTVLETAKALEERLATAEDDLADTRTVADTAEQTANAVSQVAQDLEDRLKAAEDDLADTTTVAEGAAQVASTVLATSKALDERLKTAESDIEDTRTVAAGAQQTANTVSQMAKDLEDRLKVAEEDLEDTTVVATGAAQTAAQVQAQITPINQAVTKAQTDVKTAQSKADQAFTKATTVTNDLNAYKVVITGYQADTLAAITALEDNINLRVKSGEIISQINLSPETILIAAARIHLSGETTIDAGVIKTAMIEDAAITNAKISALDAAKITTGYLAAARIKAGTITSEKLTVADGFIATAMIADAAITDAKIGSLDASKITTGFLAAERIEAGAITSDKLTVADGFIKTAMIADAAITNAKIASLDASKVTTGYLAAARIEAGAITSDKLTVADGFIKTAMIADAAITNAKIASLDASKVTTGYLAAARIEAGAITSDKLTVADGFIATA